MLRWNNILEKWKQNKKSSRRKKKKNVDGNTFGDKNFMPHSSRRMQKYILKIYECIILRKNTGKSYKNYNKNS